MTKAMEQHRKALHRKTDVRKETDNLTNGSESKLNRIASGHRRLLKSREQMATNRWTKIITEWRPLTGSRSVLCVGHEQLTMCLVSPTVRCLQAHTLAVATVSRVVEGLHTSIVDTAEVEAFHGTDRLLPTVHLL